jgi:hypothetical protein
MRILKNEQNEEKAIFRTPVNFAAHHFINK